MKQKILDAVRKHAEGNIARAKTNVDVFLNNPVGVATQDPILRKRLNPDDAALRVYNYLHAMTLEAQLLARACGKTNIHSLEPEDLAALTMEASALAKVPLSGTNHTVGVDNFHKI